jgi:pyruvate/2-oxoglutarate dehydrogenase complex dihydrolipoamide dehydrogenase (E3) component
MTETVHIENVVLGGGEAGKYIAWDLAQQGRAVVVIERALVGGSCPNIACLPSKNVIRSAKVADLIGRASSYGVAIDGATVDMKGVRQRKREMVDGMIAIHRKKFSVPHLEFLLAEGRLVGPRTVEARLPDGGSRRFVADRLFLNLGTRATIPGIPGLADTQPLTHVEALELDRLPERFDLLRQAGTARRHERRAGRPALQHHAAPLPAGPGTETLGAAAEPGARPRDDHPLLHRGCAGACRSCPKV